MPDAPPSDRTIELVVGAPDAPVGRFVVELPRAMPPPIERWIAAVILADHVALAFADAYDSRRPPRCARRPAESSRPTESMLPTLKRTLIGRPIATSEEQHQRLRKIIALPVFASDAISSTAYATEEILVVLVPVAGLAAFSYLVPLALLVLVLLTIVVVSYRQTIHAYPIGWRLLHRRPARTSVGSRRWSRARRCSPTTC